MKIGYLLKKLRLKNKFTLKDVAQKLSITSSLLSQVENNKISPSLKSLETLVGFYNINLSEFFKQVEQKDYIIVKINNAEQIIAKSGSIITLLASKLENNVIETYSVELKPGISLQIKQIDEKINGERFIYVISGQLDVLIDKNSHHQIFPEDSINFKAHVACEVKNNSYNDVKFLISGFMPLF